MIFEGDADFIDHILERNKTKDITRNYCTHTQNEMSQAFLLKNLRHFVLLGIYIGIDGILFDKLTTGTNIVTHEHREYIVGIGCILKRHLL